MEAATINVYVNNGKDDELLTSLYLNTTPSFKEGQVFYFSGWLRGIEKYIIENVVYNVQFLSEHKNFLVIELHVIKCN